MSTAFTLPLEGELTIHNAADMRLMLQSALGALDASSCPDGVSLDLTAVSELDSAGVQLLLAARRSLRERGVSLRLHPLGRGAAEVLATLGLNGDAQDDAGAVALRAEVTP